jgi:penicillin-binding protein 1A
VIVRLLSFIVAFLLLAVGIAKSEPGSEHRAFWNLEPEELRLLLASPQVMATRTASGWDSYCRCPVILTPAEVPEVMKSAIVAVEDKRFFDHGGVDLITLLSVLKGGLSRGGSTIPMQLLKNIVLHDLQQRDFLSRMERKGSEFWYASTFDGAVGKQELLAAYLNQVEFGGREIVGLYRATRHYFHKDPKDLTLYEAALLAGMVQAPGRLNPLKESTRERAHERAKLVLRLMVDQGKISEKERAVAERVGIRPGILPEFKIQAQAFTEWVTQTWGAKYVAEGETVRFFVTLDPRFQHLLERHLSDLVTEGSIPPQYDAAAVMMNGGGRVQAMVGGIDWSRNQFNNAVKATVQPGSTAKLPLVIAACEQGKSPDARVEDRPLTENWPSNGALGYKGQTTLKEAIASSRNAAAVRLTRDLGVGAVAEVSRRLGIDPGPELDPGFVLGTFSSNVLSMTGAYAAAANGGFRVVPTGVLAAVDGRGNVRANLMEGSRTRVIARRCVAPTWSVLNEVIRSGTGRGAALRRWKAYGKTGTTTGNADAWFIGWSEGRVLGIWMGKRRGDESAAIAGMGAPADLFKRVSNSANELVDRRLSKEPHRPDALVAGIQPRDRGRADPMADAAQTSMHRKQSSAARIQVPTPPRRPKPMDRSAPESLL